MLHVTGTLINAGTVLIEPMQKAPSAPAVTPSALPAPGSGLAGLLGGVG